MSLFEHPEFDNHEDVIYCSDRNSGLRAIIAIHSTQLGPAAGGCRMYPYQSVDAALADALRLSRGMTYKNAIADLPLGGGKSVIIADPNAGTKEALLRSFALHVQRLAGAYWTAIDIGVGPEDADLMAETCDYIFARASQYPEGFDASIPTAMGGFVALRAAVRSVMKRDDLAGVRVAIQGVGRTGRELTRLLTQAGAEVVVADVNEETVQEVVSALGTKAVEPDAIHAQDVEVFAPCAIGGVLNVETTPNIRARIVCGVANNQLARPGDAIELHRRGIIYVPDFLANCAGMIAAGPAILTGPDPEWSDRKIQALGGEVEDLLRCASESGQAPIEIAEQRVLERIA